MWCVEHFFELPQSTMILAAAAFAALLQVSQAHICMWSPPQREGAGQIAYPGEQ